MPQINLFVNRNNMQVARFLSRLEDPKAEGGKSFWLSGPRPSVCLSTISDNPIGNKKDKRIEGGDHSSN